LRRNGVTDGHAVLAPTNEAVDVINDMVLDGLPGPATTYYSYDSVKEVEGTV